MALERTDPRNNPATTTPKTAQQRGISEPPIVAREITGSEAQATLQNFIDLVRITAACEHGRLLYRRDIELALDTDDAADPLNTTREQRQAWAAAIAHRLAAPDPSWQPALEALRKVKA
jgi:hypothetical protein